MVKNDQLKLKIEIETPTTSSSKLQKVSSTSTSCKKNNKFKGVRMRSWGSWVSEIRAPNQKTRIWLGSYSTAEAAARAYDAALLCLKGSSANLNFPITSSHQYNIPTDTAMSPKSIQRVAAAAAAAAAAPNADSFNNVSNNDILSTPPQPISPPQVPSSSSSSSYNILSSSPISSMSTSSPSDQFDDDVSIMQCLGYDEPPALSSWYSFDDGLQYSPKYNLDQMFNGVVSSFDIPPPPPLIDDFLEEGDIRLWSFC